jgi:hypothetical protein
MEARRIGRADCQNQRLYRIHLPRNSFASRESAMKSLKRASSAIIMSMMLLFSSALHGVYAANDQLDELASIKALNKSTGPFRKGLKLSSGEFAVGDPATRATAADITDSLQTPRANNRAEGIMTLCPIGELDNQPSPKCRVIGVSNTFNVEKATQQRWIADIKPQLIGDSPWLITPEKNLSGFALRNVTQLEPALDACMARLLKAKDSSEACFNADQTQTQLLIANFCLSDVKKQRDRDIEVNPNISNPPSYCAIDFKTGLVVAIYLPEPGGKAVISIFNTLPTYEIVARDNAAKAQQQQQEYVAPKL